MIITSKQNPVVKLIKSLQDKKFRRIHKLYIVDGIKCVKECIDVGCSIEYIVTTQIFSGQYEKQIIVSDEIFAWLSEEKTPQGVMAVVHIPELELMASEESCLLLDGIQDPGNIGTIIRTANAAGYRNIYLINCVDPYSPKVVRSSMSGIFFVNIFQGKKEDIFNAISGLNLICADMDGENIFEFEPPEKYCLCVGNEGNGISPEIKEMAASTIRIPMEQTAESLNVGVSAAIAMYELKRNSFKTK